TATSYVSDHEGADGVDRVGVLGALVGAVAQDPGETEGHAARIAGRALHAVEGDLHHQLWTDLYGPLVRGTLGEFQEAFRLPGEQLVGQALEGLPQHDEPARRRVAGAEMEVGQLALPAAVTPLGGQDHQVERVAGLHLDPARAAPPGRVRGRQRLDDQPFVTGPH